jgi:hypothetical protein
MIKSVSEFSDGVIRAMSRNSTNPNELWSGFFDFAIIGTSWDRRCTAITQCLNLTFSTVVEVVPFDIEQTGSLADNHQKVSEFCTNNSSDFQSKQSKTSNLPETLAEIKECLWSAIGNADRKQAARVFIDISTCPRYFTLAILVEAFRSGLVEEIFIAYSEGIYPDAAPSYEDLEEISFTDGAFHAVPIPGFFGEFEPSKRDFFLVSTGFDGWKTLNLLIRKEPERVAALVASPGVSADYERRALAANAALFSRFGILEERTIKAAAGDAIEAWMKVTTMNLEDFDDENVNYLCSGNKAHSLALALRAIAKESPAVLYNRPTKHLPSNVECSGVFWSYSIEPTSGTVFG